MAFPGPGYRSPRKKEDLKTKEEITLEETTIALRKYLKIKNIIVDDVNIDFDVLNNAWVRLTFEFRRVE